MFRIMLVPISQFCGHGIIMLSISITITISIRKFYTPIEVESKYPEETITVYRIKVPFINALNPEFYISVSSFIKIQNSYSSFRVICI